MMPQTFSVRANAVRYIGPWFKRPALAASPGGLGAHSTRPTTKAPSVPEACLEGATRFGQHVSSPRNKVSREATFIE